MSLGTLGFQLYTDSGLTTLFSGVESLVNFTDFSDNPQIFLLYYGSAATTTTYLRALSAPGTAQITITPTDILPQWAASTAYTLGQAVQPTSPNTRYYTCTTAGTSDSSQPTWPTGGIGSVVTDGSVVWTLSGFRHPLTEIKLSRTLGGLSTATAGAALNMGTVIQNGVANAETLYIQITNAVNIVSDDSTTPHNALFVNGVIQQAV